MCCVDIFVEDDNVCKVVLVVYVNKICDIGLVIFRIDGSDLKNLRGIDVGIS